MKIRITIHCGSHKFEASPQDFSNAGSIPPRFTIQCPHCGKLVTMGAKVTRALLEAQNEDSHPKC